MASSIIIKKPKMKESVGSMYYSFNKPASGVTFDASSYEDEIVKTDVVKNIGVTENLESQVVRASGEDYETVNKTSSEELEVEIVAFDPDDLAKMRGETIYSNGLMQSGDEQERPFFAFGKVVKKIGGGFQYVWYPKCQLIENSDDIATSEESFSEQNDKVKIKAYKFDKKHIKNHIDSDSANFPEGLTEEKFFSKVIVTKEDLDSIVTAKTA